MDENRFYGKRVLGDGQTHRLPKRVKNSRAWVQIQKKVKYCAKVVAVALRRWSDVLNPLSSRTPCLGAAM